ncbi:response regulator [Pseudohongiella spirulinae]|uniref:histidine kinase n=1 Tax=Pseudohongiella spirulinae TaxID=1249552 RepID=A0A0S2KF05_9GAMM|nr:response regulator [Pseudohongiella spirulinae]ALO46893.1 hypothetical protein PS2015_2258 [Pseudohongiella spirulinae]
MNSDTYHEVQRALSSLRQTFIKDLEDRIDIFSQLAIRLHEADPQSARQQHFDTLYLEIHRLAGAAGTFGLFELSESAVEVDRFMSRARKDKQIASSGFSAQLVGAIAELEKIIRQVLPLAAAERPVSDAAFSRRKNQPVFIVEDDLQQAEKIQLALSDAGYQTELFLTQESFSQRMEQTSDSMPLAVVMDIMFPDDDSGGLELLGKYSESFSEFNIPVVVLSVRDDMMARLRAFRAGASRYLSKPADTGMLVDLLDTLTGRRPVEPYRVLLVDDDALLMKAHASALTAAGMNVLCVGDPLNILEALNGFDPDVAIIDVYMPDVSGPELAAVLRERFAYLHMPIIFLSAESDLSQQLMALNLGGDDFMVKPVLPEHLIAAVSARARRARQASAIRTKLETTLYEREREHVALNQHAIVSIADGRGDIIYVNDKFCEIAGYQRHELLGLNHRVVKSGLHDAEFYGDMWSTIKQGEVWQGEICNRKKDGSLYWVSSTITPFLDSDGKPYQYVSIRTDITEIKSRELEQKRQSDLRQLIAEVGATLMDAPASAMDDAVEQSLALAGQLLGAERANLFQYAADNGTVTHTHEWFRHGLCSQKARVKNVPVADLPWWWDAVQTDSLIYLPDINALPSDATAEKAFFRSLGISSVIALPIVRDAKVSGLLGFATLNEPHAWREQDLKLLQVVAELISSALKRCEAELRAESHKEMLRIGQVFANIGTWDWNIKTNQLYWTERIAPLFGYEEGEVETSYDNFMAAVHPEDRQAVGDAINASLNDKQPYEIEHRVVWPDGTVRWLLERGSVVYDADGVPDQMIGVVQDIDDRKRAEMDLQAARLEADRANLAKSEFLSSMSHELRTPMNVILGFAQLLRYDEDLSEEAKDSVSEILKSGNHLLELINEVLDLAKIESGRLTISQEPIEINQLLNDCVRQISPLADERNIGIRVVTESSLAVVADHTRLRQILLNLLSNAVKYNRESGRISVDICRLEKGRIKLSITDTGTGIEDDQISHIFEPFNRLGKESSAVEGTGIGLAISKQLIEMMGGEIHVSSTKGEGSCFWIVLDAADSISSTDLSDQIEPCLDAPDLTISTERRPVLYIEDNPSNIRLMANIVSKRPDFEFVSAMSPQLGIDLAQSRKPDLIFLDINLPDMDGYAVLRKLRNIDALKATPVIAITANAMKKDMERGMAAGFADYLTKPIQVSEVLAILQRHSW